MNKLLFTLGALAMFSLVGCTSSGSKPLYSWGQYPEQSYLLLSASEKTSPEKQIIILEKDIEKAKAKNEAIPPGLYAHLGLLNLDIQQPQRATTYFELERQIYPESTILMDRLLQKASSNLTGVK